MNLIRGIRNNNPGNIKAVRDDWNGQIGIDDAGFCIFENPYYGLRAMAKVLINYKKLHGISTIRGVIMRYSATDQESYISTVSNSLNRSPDDQYDFTTRRHLTGLMKAMITVECSFFPYSYKMLRAGIDFAFEAARGDEL